LVDRIDEAIVWMDPDVSRAGTRAELRKRMLTGYEAAATAVEVVDHDPIQAHVTRQHALAGDVGPNRMWKCVTRRNRVDAGLALVLHDVARWSDTPELVNRENRNATRRWHRCEEVASAWVNADVGGATDRGDAVNQREVARGADGERGNGAGDAFDRAP